MEMSWFANDYPLHIGADRIKHIIIYNPDETRVCIVEWAAVHRGRETEVKRYRNRSTEERLSSVWCTSRCRSSAPVRLPHPAGCGCVSAANADSELGHRIPSLPARPSWRREIQHLLEATYHRTALFIYVIALLWSLDSPFRYYLNNTKHTFSEPVCPVNRAL